MLLSNLNLLATAPGGVARLRELILTLAVQGKLVPQDPNDEQASELLKKIRAEKDRLIAAGKIKRDQQLAEISAGKKPFELPEGWEWVRLGIVTNISTGKLDANAAVANGQYPFFTCSNTPLAIDRYSFECSAVLLAGNGDFNLKHYTGKFDAYQRTYVIQPILINLKFLYFTLNKYIGELTKNQRGSAIPYLKLGDITDPPIPISPLAEQSRIVTRVEELMRLCDALEAKGQLEATQHAQLVSTLLGTLTKSETPEELAENWHRVATHFDLLLDRPEAVEALEQTILQLAVRGLLVPQDPQDEPASALLKKIRVEKDKLIAEGKIKRDKPLAEIAEGESTFDLPKGWEWSNLATVGVINPRNEATDEAIASFVEMRSIPAAFSAAHTTESRPWRDIKSGFTQFAEGDVGVAKITPCFENGKSTVFENLSNGIGAGTTELHIVRPLGGIAPRYVLLFLKTPAFLLNGEAVMTGSAGQKRMPRTYFEGTPFPLPPLAEQSRIVTRVVELMRLCADFRQRLTTARAQQALLAKGLMKEFA